ncbi:HMCN1 [Symbiodinium natans]|uniref:HMCN1 protein n=1 Tax=Symbiodinium natans TaxID=878477 RepID=A0A812JDF0_9DINO|nr:HMCN1 [Symbiodinium natans]
MSVKYVVGLQKCLQQSGLLTDDQVQCASDIDMRAKSLFEPKYGGRYETFQERPLRDVILMYAAHDSRYMLDLYNFYISKLPTEWQPRVFAGSAERASWFKQEYKRPGTDAPDF